MGCCGETLLLPLLPFTHSDSEKNTLCNACSLSVCLSVCHDCVSSMSLHQCFSSITYKILQVPAMRIREMEMDPFAKKKICDAKTVSHQLPTNLRSTKNRKESKQGINKS